MFRGFIQKLLQYADDARHHARLHILKGSTQLENNELEKDYFQLLYRGMGDIDGEMDDSHSYGMRHAIKDQVIDVKCVIKSTRRRCGTFLYNEWRSCHSCVKPKTQQRPL